MGLHTEEFMLTLTSDPPEHDYGKRLSVGYFTNKEIRSRVQPAPCHYAVKYYNEPLWLLTYSNLIPPSWVAAIRSEPSIGEFFNGWSEPFLAELLSRGYIPSKSDPKRVGLSVAAHQALRLPKESFHWNEMFRLLSPELDPKHHFALGLAISIFGLHLGSNGDLRSLQNYSTPENHRFWVYTRDTGDMFSVLFSYIESGLATDNRTMSFNILETSKKLNRKLPITKEVILDACRGKFNDS